MNTPTINEVPPCEVAYLHESGWLMRTKPARPATWGEPRDTTPRVSSGSTVTTCFRAVATSRPRSADQESP